MVASVLTIAGSDSGGGAGIQADLKTFAAHGVHGLTAIAALTAQNTRAVTAVDMVDTAFLRAQVDACFDDFDIRVVKLGMLGTTAVILAVADAIEHYQPQAVVLDPVMVATSGARLLEPEALEALRTRLLPRATVVTPNVPEAELLLDRPITGLQDIEDASGALRALGAPAVLLKGGHAMTQQPAVVDLLLDSDGRSHRFEHPRLALEAHGTGCTLASAVASQLALGASLPEACRLATDYVHRALARGYRPGRSDTVVLDHMGAAA